MKIVVDVRIIESLGLPVINRSAMILPALSDPCFDAVYGERFGFFATDNTDAHR